MNEVNQYVICMSSLNRGTYMVHMARFVKTSLSFWNSFSFCFNKSVVRMLLYNNVFHECIIYYIYIYIYIYIYM